jgi:hypothetical protein
MQETKERTCAERIEENLNALRAELDALNAREDDRAGDELADMSLHIETHYETTVTLSWGGPADYLHIVHNGEEVLKVTYRFSDWFDTAIIEVGEEDETIWGYAQHIIEGQELAEVN